MLDRVTRAVLIGLDLLLGVTALIGGLNVVPTLPPEWLAGSPFTSYTLPALALTMLGASAAVGGLLMIVRLEWGIVVSFAVGTAIAIFEIVEATVLGVDVWLHALGLGPTPTSAITRANVDGIPAPLGIALPLWFQPAYFMVGIMMVGLALRLVVRRRRRTPHSRYPALLMN